MLGCKTITYWLGNIIQNFISKCTNSQVYEDSEIYLKEVTATVSLTVKSHLHAMVVFVAQIQTGLDREKKMMSPILSF